jgi:hypothetical protein
MLTIIVPNYFDYDRVNFVIEEYNTINFHLVHLIVVDAGNESESCGKIKTLCNDKIQVFYGLSSGVYDAFNFGIAQVKTKYYMVLGVDDIFNFNKLDLIINVLKYTDYDLLFLGIIKSGIVSNSLKIDSILSGPQGVFPSHTGGTIINKNLHDKYGLYSNNYKVLADSFFISQCLMDKNIKFGLLSEIFCLVGDQGFSKRKELLSECEAFLIRNKLGQIFVISYCLFFIRSSKRIVKNILRFFHLR